ncbi:hypothetical protein FACS1894132_12470 [Clostridia bacterium]|nr:hypothetical protein FACS1894132_12470 [Clostridia bacterium]
MRQELNKFGARFSKSFDADTIPKHTYGIYLQRTDVGEYKIKNANSDYSSRSVEMTSTFGTEKMNGYNIFENLLNGRDCVIKKDKIDEHGRTVLNKSGNVVRVIDFK